MKNHQKHFLGIQNIIGSPNFSHQNHWISIIWDGQDSQKLHLQDHPIRLGQWQLRTLCLKELPELGVWPRSAPHRVIRVFIIHIYIFNLFICNFIYIYIYINNNNNNNIYIYIHLLYKGNCLWENQPRPQQTSSGRPGRCCSPCFDKLDDTVF